MANFLEEVGKELSRATDLHGPTRSVHEGYALMLEELDEFWEEVRKREGFRDKQHMFEELVQIAAMAGKTAEMINGSILGEATEGV